MSIKSDKWIKKMSEEKDMISPFQPNQIKRNESTDEKLISYGLSSYGYDVRCASEFKVFTNIHSATVDPKKFDSTSFIDVDKEECIILQTHLLWLEPSNILKFQETFLQSA